MSILYNIFIATMRFLEHNFGYPTAIFIKNMGDAAVTLLIGGYLLLLLAAKFYMACDVDDEMNPDLIILLVDHKLKKFSVNPSGPMGVVYAFFAWCFVRLSREGSLKHKKFKKIIVAIICVSIVVMFFGLLFTVWTYMPDGKRYH